MTLLTGCLGMARPLTEATDSASSASWPGSVDGTRCGSAASIPGSLVDVLRRAVEVAGRQQRK